MIIVLCIKNSAYIEIFQLKAPSFINYTLRWIKLALFRLYVVSIATAKHFCIRWSTLFCNFGRNYILNGFIGLINPLHLKNNLEICSEMANQISYYSLNAIRFFKNKISWTEAKAASFEISDKFERLNSFLFHQHGLIDTCTRNTIKW